MADPVRSCLQVRHEQVENGFIVYAGPGDLLHEGLRPPAYVARSTSELRDLLNEIAEKQIKEIMQQYAV